MDEDEHSFYLEFLTEEADFWKEVKKKEPGKSTPVRWAAKPAQG